MIRIAFAIVAALFLAASLRSQTTFNVPSAVYPTIQSALSVAVSGDTVQVAAGTYVENVVWSTGDVRLIGAGVGQSIIDGNGVGCCIRFNGPTSNAALVEGFTLTNGLGDYYAGYPNVINSQGGGILLRSTMGAPQPTIRNCEISNCAADDGAACYAYGNLTLENVDIHSCTSGLIPGSLPASIVTTGWSALLVLDGCRIHGNQASYAIVAGRDYLQMTACEIDANICDLTTISLNGYYGVFRRCNVHGNQVTRVDGGQVTFVASSLDLSDNLIWGNVGGAAVLFAAGSGLEDVGNCSIVGNQLSSTPLTVLGVGATTGIANTIIWGNTDSSGAAVTSVIPLLGTYQTFTGNIRSSIIEGAAGSGPGVTSVNPLFVDQAAGDLRLGPGSPGLDAGVSNVVSTSLTGLFPDDLRGLPRVRNAVVDLGAIEGWEGGLNAASLSRIGAGLGGPFDCLQVNGSAGNVLGEVTATVGSPIQISVLQPASAASPLGFSIFGLIGEAAIEQVTTVPLGIGAMSFAPAPLYPYLQPYLFTAASTVGPINSVSAITAAQPTPWIAPSFSLPFPLILSFQAVIEEAPGVYTPANLVVLKVQ